MRIWHELDVTGLRGAPLVERRAHVGGWSLGNRLSRKGDLCHGSGLGAGSRLLQRVGSATGRVGVTMRLR